MHINNEIGTMIDLKKIGIICHSHNAMFHSDTVQTIGHFPLDLSLINIDFIHAQHINFMVQKVLVLLILIKKKPIPHHWR